MIRRLMPVLLLLVFGCGEDLWRPPAAMRVLASKEKFLLQYSRKPGQLDRYRASFTVRARGATWAEEDVEQVIYDETIYKVREGLHKVAFRRRDLTRTSRRQGRKGQIVEDVPLDRDPDITPNFFVERGNPRKYYVVSSRGIFAMRKARDRLDPDKERFQYPFHYVVGESLAFLLPVLPEEAKKVGVEDKWAEEIPVIVGHAYMRNDFFLKVTQVVESTALTEDKRKLVVIGFKLEGTFDSGDPKFARRFTDEERTNTKLRTAVAGEGKVYFDPVLGKAIWKNLRYTVVSAYQRKALLPRGEGTGETSKEDVTETTFSFACRLMRPGEKVTMPREPRVGP